METAALYKIFNDHPQVCTDTRKLKKGDLFFALKGTNFDGNVYAQKALELGASMAVVDDAGLAGKEKMIVVDNVLETLQQLSNHHRKQFTIPIIAITGSNGKTTTKELLNLVLSARYQTHYTKGNLNNHIGLPLTLLAMPLHTEVAVIEMGANHQGEIDFLCRIAEPTHGLITNIGKAHLDGFGGLEGVKKGKSELYRFLATHNGMAFINKEEPFLEELAKEVSKKLFYQSSETLNSLGSYYDIQLKWDSPFIQAAFISEEGQTVEISSNLIGHYNFKNIMTAIALGKYFKVPAKKIKQSIENYIPTNNRSQWIQKDSNTYLLDAYNANPSSMSAALSYFASIEAVSKVVVLGDMLELGADSETLHRDILEQALASRFDQCIFVGPIFSKSAIAYGFSYFSSVEELKPWFEHQNFQNTHFLIKGSRGIQLEKLLE